MAVALVFMGAWKQPAAAAARCLTAGSGGLQLRTLGKWLVIAPAAWVWSLWLTPGVIDKVLSACAPSHRHGTAVHAMSCQVGDGGWGGAAYQQAAWAAGTHVLPTAAAGGGPCVFCCHGLVRICCGWRCRPCCHRTGLASSVWEEDPAKDVGVALGRQQCSWLCSEAVHAPPTLLAAQPAAGLCVGLVAGCALQRRWYVVRVDGAVDGVMTHPLAVGVLAVPNALVVAAYNQGMLRPCTVR